MQGGLLTDDEFPPNRSSLSGDPNKPSPHEDKIVWRRPSEFCKGLNHPSLFVGGFDESDVVQGLLGKICRQTGKMIRV